MSTIPVAGSTAHDPFLIGRITPGDEPVEGAAEIVAFDPLRDRLYVTNGDSQSLDIFDISDPTAPELFRSVDLDGFGGITSVDVAGRRVAVALPDEDGNENGQVALLNLRGQILRTFEVGVLPDSLAFSPDGRLIVTANEGEPTDTGDPLGSVSIIDWRRGPAQAVTTLDFTGFDGQEDALRAEGVRIAAGLSASQDLEPEFVAIAPDGRTAIVTLQENNAVAIVDLVAREIVDIVGLGTVDHSLPGNGIDASDDDGVISIRNWPVHGLFMPDGVAAFEAGGQTFFAIANEGDDRGEDVRVEDITLDPTAFPDAATLQLPDNLGRLNVSGVDGDSDGDGDFDQLFAYGSRSFTILDAQGNIVWNSGDQLEQLTARFLPADFNSDQENDSFDSRSDNKGPEPEGIAVGTVDGALYAFIGLERVGGVVIYDISDPTAPSFVRYINGRDFSAEDGTLAAGDIGPEGLTFIAAEDSPTGEALLAVAHEVSGTTAIYELSEAALEPQIYRLQILHASDLEGGVEAIGRAASFAAIIDRLEDLEGNSITLSAGDNFISGPFFNAAADALAFRDGGVFNAAFNRIFGLPRDVDGDGIADGYAGLREGGGRVDIAIMNAIGFDASALGNHEFDLGTDTLGGLLRPDFQGLGLADDRWVGTQFPYLSANLDFSADSSLAPLFTDELLLSTQFGGGPEESLGGVATPRIAASTLIEEGGELIGVVGATTQVLGSISSPGATTVIGPTVDDMPALAAILQPEIDRLIEAGSNKIILVSHLQQIALERELAGLLEGVDVIIAGGSDTILADGDDALNPGDVAADTYPIITTNADGDPLAIVSTDGEYAYVGRLVLEFDDQGRLLTDSIDPALNGPVAATADNVVDLWGTEAAAFASGSRGAIVRELVEEVSDVVEAQDGNLFGETTVFLDGRRSEVRTEETNLGNLTADANLDYAQEIDPTVLVSIKNGGGIRAAIGEVDQLGELLPPQANPAADKEEGEISQLDIVNALRFNNSLTLVTLTAEQLLAVAEHAVAASAPGATPGQFAQIGGMAFSFDPTQVAGSRVESLAIVNEAGEVVDTIAESGEVVGDPTRGVRVVTLNFLADGGDGYPIAGFIAADPAFADRVDLGQGLSDPRTGEATFAADGTEQDALAEYLVERFPIDGPAPFDQAETDPAEDLRIQNLLLREDTVLDGISASELLFA